MTRRSLMRALGPLALLLTASAVSAAPAPRGGGGGAPPVLVKAAETREAQAARSFLGDVQPSRRVRVGGELAGLVDVLHVEVGQRVEAKAPLAELRKTFLTHRLSAARAAQRALQAALADLEAGARAEEIRRADAIVARAEAALENASSKLAASQRLFEDGKRITREQLRDDELSRAEASASLDAERAALDLLRAGARPELIAAAKARVSEQEAVIGRLEEEEARHVIRAPFAGYVVAEHTEVGAWLGQGGAVVELIALDEVDVVVPVDEEFVPALREGTEVGFRTPALPGRLFAGTLLYVVPDASVRTRAFPVRIRVKNELVEGAPLLRPGMSATISLGIGPKAPRVMVPKDALRLGGRTPEVAVVEPEGDVIRLAPVQLGVMDGGWVEVIGPVKAGDRVIVKGNERVGPGMPVTPTDAP